MASHSQGTVVLRQLLLPVASSPAKSVTAEQFSAFFHLEDLIADQTPFEFTEPAFDTIGPLVTQLVNPAVEPSLAPLTEHQPNLQLANRAFDKYNAVTHNKRVLNKDEVRRFWRGARSYALEVHDPEEWLSPSFAGLFEKKFGLAVPQGISENEWRDMDERSRMNKVVGMQLAKASTQVIALPKGCVLEGKDLNNHEALAEFSNHLRKFARRKGTSKRISGYIDRIVLRNFCRYRQLLRGQQKRTSRELVTNEVAQSIEVEGYDSDATTVEPEIKMREKLMMIVQNTLDELVRADHKTTGRRQNITSPEALSFEGQAYFISDPESERSSEAPSVFSTEATELDETLKDPSPEDAEMEESETDDMADGDWIGDRRAGKK